MPDLTFTLMLDSIPFKEKPTKAEAEKIRSRFHKARPITLALDDLKQAIEQGRAFCPGVTIGRSDDAHWQRQQAFGVDLDNQFGSGKNKRVRKADEGYLSPEAALRICEEHGIQPALAYYSFSDKHDTSEPWARYRLVFVLDREITDKHEQEQLATWFVGLFGAATDSGCKEPSRLFYGGRSGSVFRCEPVVCNTDAVLSWAVEAETERKIAEIEAEAERKATAERHEALPGYDPHDYDADPEQLLHMINPNKLSYPAWRGVCSAFKSCGGTREQWLDWCSLYDGDDPKEDTEFYDGINRGSDRPTTAGTLKFFAEQHSPNEYKLYMNELDRQQKAAIEKARADSGPFTVERLDAFLNTHGISCRYNEIQHRIEFSGLPAKYDGERSTAQAPVVILSMLKDARVKGVSIQTVSDYLDVIASQHHFNPVAEILNSIVWDNRRRVPDLIKAMNLPEGDKLSTVLVHKWLRQAISLAIFNDYRHPFGADGVLVLCGPQGIGKTTFARVLGINSDLFKPGLVVDPHDKDTLMKATSCFVGELGEVETTMKRDIPALKSFLTAESDEIDRHGAHIVAPRINASASRFEEPCVLPLLLRTTIFIQTAPSFISACRIQNQKQPHTILYCCPHPESRLQDVRTNCPLQHRASVSLRQGY